MQQKIKQKQKVWKQVYCLVISGSRGRGQAAGRQEKGLSHLEPECVFRFQQ